ncbi:MAG TPA: sugar porter family MFS transporter [Gemmatimonadota bacterium]|nr:sugar porter family MFS transporter [Gemmatimonadota bacterium]
MRSYRTVVTSTLVAALGGLLFGFDTAVISGTTESLQSVFSLTEFWLGFAVAAALIGTILGALSAGRPAETLGRRPVLFALAVLFLVSAIGSAIAGTLATFAVFRFLGGLGVGAASVVAPMYIAEISPARLRGRLVAVNQLNVVLGILLAFLSNYLIAQAIGGATAWRWMLGIEAVPAVLFFLLLFRIPESPRWLVRQDRLGEARRVLEQLGEPDVDRELDEIAASLRLDGTRRSEPLFQKRYTAPIALAWAVAMLNQLSGVNALMYYAPRIFQMAGAAATDALLQSTAIGGTNLVFTIVAMFLIDRLGRRPLLIVGGVGAAASLLMTAAGFLVGGDAAGLVLVGLIGFIACHAIGQGAVIWVFLSEIFPNRVRAKGQALGAFTHWLMAAVVSWSFPVLASAAGGHAFTFFAVMMGLQALFAWKLMPETRNASLEELEYRLGLATPELAAVERQREAGETAVAEPGRP